MWSSGDLCSQPYRCGIHTVSDCVTVIGGQNATLYRYPLLWPDGSRGESSAGRPRPDKVHKPARTAHDARSRRECLRPRLTGPRGVPALDPRPSILVPRSSFLDPRSSTLDPLDHRASDFDPLDSVDLRSSILDRLDSRSLLLDPLVPWSWIIYPQSCIVSRFGA